MPNTVHVPPGGVVRILVPMLKGNKQVQIEGSGYAVAPRLILTARHVVDPNWKWSAPSEFSFQPNDPIQVFLPDSESGRNPKSNSVELTAQRPDTNSLERTVRIERASLVFSVDDDLDAALIHSPEDLTAATTHLDPSAIRAYLGNSGKPWAAIGFPSGARLHTEQQKSWTLYGAVNQLLDMERGLVQLTNQTPIHDYSGFSGSGVFGTDGQHSRFLGVLVQQSLHLKAAPDSSAIYRWAGGQAIFAVPAFRIVDDERLGRVLREVQNAPNAEPPNRARLVQRAKERLAAVLLAKPNFLRYFDTGDACRLTGAAESDVSAFIVALNKIPALTICDGIALAISDSPPLDGALADELLSALLPLALQRDYSRSSARQDHVGYPYEVEIDEALEQGRPAFFRMSNCEAIVVGLGAVESVGPLGFDAEGSQQAKAFAEQLLTKFSVQHSATGPQRDAGVRSDLNTVLAQLLSIGGSLFSLAELKQLLKRGRRNPALARPGPRSDWIPPYIVFLHKPGSDKSRTQSCRDILRQEFGSDLPTVLIELPGDREDHLAVELEVGIKKFLEFRPKYNA
jgi:Trypsin-like peptidase domain